MENFRVSANIVEDVNHRIRNNTRLRRTAICISNVLFGPLIQIMFGETLPYNSTLTYVLLNLTDRKILGNETFDGLSLDIIKLIQRDMNYLESFVALC
jgi:hypothetical protein